MAAVNFVSINQISHDVQYKDCRYTGLTAFKEFDVKKDYKLIPREMHGSEYLIKSVNNLTRLTQLLLQEVGI